MHKSFSSLVVVCALWAPVAQAADTSLRPGLWELSTTSDLLKLVPHIPPDQMQNLRSMAKQYGLALPDIQNGAAKSMVCITQQMADQKTLPDLYHEQSGCTAKNAARTGNRVKLDYVCSSARLTGNGSAEGVITTSESFSGRTQFAGSVQGNPVNEQAELSGRWMGASCGAVKAAR